MTQPASVLERWPLTVPDVARQLGIGEETVRRLVRARALRAYRHHGHGGPRGELRFCQPDIDDYIERRRL